MPPLGRTCSECGNTLSGKSVRAKTCSKQCRQKRSRRIRDANHRLAELEEQQGVGAAEIAAIVRRESPDVITGVMKDELRPIVREALTEDVLRAVQKMLGLTPRAVELLAEDLESDDSTVRQRAYTLVTKYTIGHPALLKSEDTDGSKQLVVNFNLPRPDEPQPEAVDALGVELEEERECDMCHGIKPASSFEAGSERCSDCFELWKRKVIEQFE